MATYCKVTLIGNVGRDAEVRSVNTQSGPQKVGDFSLAVNTQVPGREEQHTDWYKVTFWGRQADVVEKYVKKGTQIYVEGRLTVRNYIDNSGKERYSLEVRGSELQLLGSANRNNDNNDAPTNNYNSQPNVGNESASQYSAVSPPTAAYNPQPPSTDDDLPF